MRGAGRDRAAQRSRALRSASATSWPSNGVTLALPAGRLTAIIGPNGAGKTTLINLVTGALVPDSGAAPLQGRSDHAARRPPADTQGLVALVPDHEHLRAPVGAAEHPRAGAGAARARRHPVSPAWSGRRKRVAEARRILRRDRPCRRRSTLPAGALSHGDQRLLELGIAIAPGAGALLSRRALVGADLRSSATRVLELIRKLSAERRTTFVIVEHDMDVVFALAEWIVVMNRGQVLAEGPPAEIRENRAVREVYLGEEVLSVMLAGPRPRDRLRPGRGDARRLARRRRRARWSACSGATARARARRCAASWGSRRRAAGAIEFMGQEITRRQPFEIARLGIGYIPDDRRIFADLTVEENLRDRPAGDAPRRALDARARLPAVSRCWRSCGLKRGAGPLGRGAEDARDRPRAHGQSRPAHTGRALGGL